MFRTVIPDSAASCSIVSVLVVSGASTVCRLSLSNGSPYNVTANDGTVIADMPRYDPQARILGLLDVFAGPPGVDGYLEQIRPTWARRECRAAVIGVRHGTPDSVTLTLRANRAWQGFRAGQFVRVAVEIDGVRRARCYSPASVAGAARELELTVKSHPEGLVSNFLIERATPGMFVALEQADGDFHLPDERPERILLISGGSGITPVMSMLRTLCDEDHRGPISFLHFAPDPERAIYRDELERIAAAHPNVRLTRSYTRASGVGEADGHFDPALLDRCEPDHARAETFACGPPALLDAVRATWAANGLEPRLHVESFVPPTLAPPSGVAEGSIHFSASDLRLDNSGASLLEQAESAGLTPETGCRMGICHTCSCRKSAGTVRNLVTGEVSSAEDEEIQICVSAPVGDVVVDL
jgi:ferredoxin-NADP reductase